MYLWSMTRLSVTALLIASLWICSCEGAVQCRGGKLDRKVINDEILGIINSRRSRVAKGIQSNGVTGTMLPIGKNFNKMTWSCDLEKKAMRYGNCQNKGRGAPSSNAAVMYSEYYFDENIRTVITSLIGNIDHEGLNANGNVVRYQGAPNLKAYVNLVRASTSQIGCAWNRCGENYIMFCLTNQPQLRSGQEVYTVGRKICDCPSGRSCDMWEGLCK